MGWSYQFNTDDLSGNKNNGSSACNCIFCNSLARNRYMWPSLPLAVLCHHGTSHWQSPLLMYLSNRTFPCTFPNQLSTTIPWNGHMTQQKNIKKTWYTHGTSPFFPGLFGRQRGFPSLLPTAAPLSRFGHHIGLNHLAARPNFHFGEVILNI